MIIRLQGDATHIRQAAGLLLKNNLKVNYQSIQPPHLQYIKGEVLPCLGSSDFGVRTTVGTIVSVVVQHGGFQGWPEIFQALVQCLDSNDYNHMEGALGALYKVQFFSFGSGFRFKFAHGRKLEALFPNIWFLSSSGRHILLEISPWNSCEVICGGAEQGLSVY